MDVEIEPDERIKKYLGRISNEKRLIVILENAALETVKIGSVFQLLNSDKHQNVLKKYNRDLNSARPDIVHQCLMMLLDSPLNQAGFLQIFIRTQRNVLIQVNPQIRIPRTFDRFCGLMIQLLHKLSIKAAGTNTKLMKVIKNPITDHLPLSRRLEQTRN
ncbi:hypothetical protein MXB_3134 [Myxobolus squamalis]|nr:hypothetical protein MXB_3134 [Myxobolus squamalis]